MTENKFDKACRLYLAMSELDDRTATEALSYRRSPSRGLRVAVIMAACVAIIVGCTLMGAVIARLVDESVDQAPGSPSMSEEAKTLSSVLNDHRSSDDSPNSTDTIALPELINGKPALIWKYQDSEEYHVKTIDDRTLNYLLSEIRYGEQIEDGGDDTDCLVWITSGNGEVYSPYLKPSAGNVGYGVLFEYDPELEPTEAFASAVSALLN